jgi:hypothetical protein
MARSSNGALISCDVGNVRGLECVRIVIKNWLSERDTSFLKTFLATTVIPLADGCYFLKAMSREQGVSGVREALVFQRQVQSGQVDLDSMNDASSPPERFDENYARRVKSAPMRVVAADDAAYDADFPDHPLSMARTTLRAVEASMSISPTLARAAPFRIGRTQ